MQQDGRISRTADRQLGALDEQEMLVAGANCTPKKPVLERPLRGAADEECVVQGGLFVLGRKASGSA